MQAKTLSVSFALITIMALVACILTINRPISTLAFNCSCSTCEECNAKLNDPQCEEVKLTADIIDHPGTCINNPSGFNNKTFDCQGHRIDGISAPSFYDGTSGVYLSNKQSNIIKNCIFTNFANGVGVWSSSNIEIISNIAISNYYGIGVWIYSHDVRLISNTTTLNFDGIGLGDSSYNNIVMHNTSVSNMGCGINMWHWPLVSNNNVLKFNRMCTNGQYDIRNDGVGNSGDNNTCDTTFYWNDEGTTGCTYACQEARFSISGRVLKANGDPIPGVTVSDNAGHTTTTDSNGNYTLSGLPAGTYIITPTINYSSMPSLLGYVLSPVTRTVTLPPDATGQNFTAITWTFAIITDFHIGYGVPDYGTEGWDHDNLTGYPVWDNYYLTERLRKVVEWINSNAEAYHIKFVAVLGDVTDTAQNSQFIKAKNILDGLTVPYFPVVGNHDLAPYALKPGTNPDKRECDQRYPSWACGNSKEGQPSSHYFTETFSVSFIQSQCSRLGTECPENHFGGLSSGLLNYYFDYGGVRFIVLDTSTRERALFGQGTGVGSDATLFNETLNFLDTVLSSGGNAVIFSHNPLRPNYSIAFSDFEVVAIDKVIGVSGARVLANFAGHTHTNSIKFDQGRRGDIIETEAVLESSDVSEIIRIGRVCMVNNRPGICSLFPPSKPLDANLNPFFTFSPGCISPSEVVTFTGCYKPDNMSAGPLSHCPRSLPPLNPHSHYFYIWQFSDDNTAHWTKDITHSFSAPGIYTATLTVAPKDAPNLIAKVWQRVEVTQTCPSPVFLNAMSTVPVLTTYSGSDMPTNQVPENSSERVTVFKLSEPKPVGEFLVHFERATQDITVTLTADIDLASRKSILYADYWPPEIEITKTLFIPSTGRGAVYICKNVTDLDQVSVESADVVINLGETKEGMSITSAFYEGREYYVVFGITGSGAGGGEMPYQIYLPLVLRNQ